MTAPIPKELLYTAYRFFGVHLAPNGKSKQISGTCFYVRAGAETFLITNRHNFELSHSHPKYVGYQLTGLAVAGYFGLDQFAHCDFEKQTFYLAVPNNSIEDVIVFDLTDVSFRFLRKRRPGEDPATVTTSLSPIAIDIEMLANEQDYKELSPGAAVAFPGYPEMFDQNGIRPILRTGSIASDPDNDYRAQEQEAGRRVAYQAHSTEGSSGSPVFATTHAGQRVLVGINSGHLTADEPKIGKIHSGLSYCFKSACISEAIEKLQLRKRS